MIKLIAGSFLLLLFSLLFFFPSKVSAATIPYTITEGIPSTLIDENTFLDNQATFYIKEFEVNYQGGEIVISGNPDGTGNHLVDGGYRMYFQYEDGSTNFIAPTYDIHCWWLQPQEPLDITSFFKQGKIQIRVELFDTCGVAVGSWPLYLVNLNAPEVTPTPSPTPAPFLSLPWDYESKGLTFNEASLAMASYFDHEYPFMDVGWTEPNYAQGTVTNYMGDIKNPKLPYSKHDGYDWAGSAKVYLGDTVLAAASGTATYHKMGEANSPCGTKSCGNTIVIDHGNGYQTRYYHLQENDLISQSFSTPKQVNQGEPIGKVGATGGWNTPHIHFSVIQDRNRDGDYQDDRPYGFTDPYGWQSDTPDPWENYIFTYADKERTGNKSYYLWKTSLESTKAALTSEPKTVTVGRYTLDFPAGAVDNTVNLDIQSSPWQKLSDSIVSIGSTIWARAKDNPGNIITTFNNPFILLVDFSPFDLSRFKPETISFYFSEDGINWTKIEGTIVDLINKKAQVEINHFSYFALMAEGIDTTAPTTNVVLSGSEGKTTWFRSDVQVTLNSQDNENGLGVYYTGYQVDGSYFREYTQPFTVFDEGKHKVEFYSVDNDNNIEEVKTIEFNIDKTPPTTNITATPLILWPPDRRFVDVTVSGSSNEDLQFNIEDEYNQIEPILKSLGDTVKFEASRFGGDLDGRVYTITATDWAGNEATQSIKVTVPHNWGI